tara:strand:- start:302 stop:1729 length:1428 start_codon:yes stop_codon:yes gene_type:complete
MASRNVKLKIETQLQKKALNDAVKGIRDVDKAMEKSGKTSVKMSNEGVKANKRNSYAAGQAAMQLQDVAVQAQMGTDSMRILGQQGPQLLSAFGPKGMLAGLAVAVGAGLVSAFRQPKKELGELIEEIERMVEVGKQIESLHADNLTNSLDETIKRANQARDAFIEMMQSREQSEQKALSATDALIEAELTLKKLKGEDVSLEEEQLKTEQAQRDIQKERNKDASELAAKRTEQLETEKKITTELEIQDANIRAARAEAQGRADALEAALGQQAEAMGKEGTFAGFDLGLTPSKGQKKATEQAKQAVQQAQAEAQKTKAELNALILARESLTQDLKDSQEAIKLTAETIDKDVAEIDMKATANSITESGNSMQRQLDVFAGSVEEAVNAFGAEAPSGIAARIKGLLEDGIQTNELADLLSATKQLTNRVNQSFGEQEMTMKEVVGQLQILSNQNADMRNKLDAVKAQNKTVRASR